MLHGEVCTVLKENFQFLAFVFLIVLLNSLMQVVESSDEIRLRSGSYGGDVSLAVPATFRQVEMAIEWSMESDPCWVEAIDDKEGSAVPLTWRTNRSNRHE